MRFFSFLALTASVAFGQATTPPDASTVANTSVELWKAKRIPELGRYLATLEKAYPNRLSSVVGSAFMDLFYRGDFEAALVKLEKVGAAIVANQIEVSGEFRLRLATCTFALSQMIKLMEEGGDSKQQRKQQADASASRNYHGSKLPDLLVLLELCSNSDLP